MTILKGSRTLIVMAAAVAVGALDFIDPSVLSSALGLGDQGRALMLIVIPLLGFGLRLITSSPVGKKV